MSRDLAALQSLFVDSLRKPFAGFAAHGCCVRFAAAAVQAQTGRALDLPEWPDAAAATADLLRRGGLAAATTSFLRPLEASARAARGDIGLLELGGVTALVVIDVDMVAGPRANGLRWLPRRLVTRAWSADA